MKVLIFLMALAGLAGCSEESPDGSPSEQDTNVAHLPEDLSRCEAPEDRQLSDIASVVEWINAMPKPVTLACFIASLPRPIKYNATESLFSAQPSIGRENPRIFIQKDKLWLSFVPQEDYTLKVDPETREEIAIWDADGIQLLEMSYEVESNRLYQQSVKGELAFPVLAQLPANAPYAKVTTNGAKTSSICSGCHGSETIVDTIGGEPVFRSTMVRNERSSEVPHGELIHQHLFCDPEVNTSQYSENNEWYRCQMLEAFYGQGEMTWSSFDETITTL